MNSALLEQLASGARIYELKLNNGETLIAEVIDIDTDDTSYMLYFPLKVTSKPQGQYLSKWFYSSRDPWIQLDKINILALSESDTEMTLNYIKTTLYLDGIEIRDDVVQQEYDIEYDGDDIVH